MICNRCLQDMRRAFMVRKRARKAEKHYFKPRRENYNQIEATDQTFDPTMPSEPEICGRSIISSTINFVENKSEEEEEHEKSDIEQQPPKDDTLEMEREESVEHDKTLILDPMQHQPKIASKSFECLICHKNLSTQQTLRNHLETVHLKIRKFSCDHCPAQFHQKTDLLTHVHRHLKNPQKLRFHNTSNILRPFKCEVENCGKYFTTKGNLKIHQTNHSGKLILYVFTNCIESFPSSDDRPFVCSCGKFFKYKTTLRRHQKDKHENLISD